MGGSDGGRGEATAEDMAVAIDVLGGGSDDERISAPSTSGSSRAEDSPIALKGYLSKQGHTKDQSRRRYFVLRQNGLLTYFKDEYMAPDDRKGQVMLFHRKSNKGKSKSYDIRLDDLTVVLDNGDRTIRAKADSLEAAQNWKVA